MHLELDVDSCICICVYLLTFISRPPARTGYGSLWAKNTKKHCFSSKHPTKYATLAKAQEACLKLGAKCSGVYDNGCDDKDEYYTCTTAKWAVSSSSCIYTEGWLVGWCRFE